MVLYMPANTAASVWAPTAATRRPTHPVTYCSASAPPPTSAGLLLLLLPDDPGRPSSPPHAGCFCQPTADSCSPLSLLSTRGLVQLLCTYCTSVLLAVLRHTMLWVPEGSRYSPRTRLSACRVSSVSMTAGRCKVQGRWKQEQRKRMRVGVLSLLASGRS